MPAEPISPEESSEVLTIKLIASKVRARGSYCTEFGEAVAELNGICANVFHAGPEGAPVFNAGAWA